MRASQIFEDDGVHLDIESGKKFVKTILYFASKYFDVTLIDFRMRHKRRSTRNHQGWKSVMSRVQSGPVGDPVASV